MGSKGFTHYCLFFLTIWTVTYAQLVRQAGFPSYVGGSETPCGPGVQPPMNYFQPYQPPPPPPPSPRYQSQPYPRDPPYANQPPSYPPRGGFFSPFQQAAMLDVDVPYEYMAFGGFPQPPLYNQWSGGAPASSYPPDYRAVADRTRSYPPSVHSSRRRVKRRAMFGMMNCQCDSATDCNMMATVRGRPYNSQCESRLRLVCCCRAG